MEATGNEFQTVESLEHTQEVRAQQSKALEYTYINIFIEETKLIFDDPRFQKQVLKGSKSMP
jgi:hypothetical protein